MNKNARNTRQDVIDFFNKHHRAPSSKQNAALYQLMQYHVYKGDKEIIALKEKYRENTEKFARNRKTKAMKPAIKQPRSKAQDTFQQRNNERCARIYKHHEETGEWPESISSDYIWVATNRSKLEVARKLWEDMHKDGKRRRRKPTNKVSFDSIKEKKVSDLTPREVSKLLKLIRNKTVTELIKEQEDPMKVDISKIETTLSEDDIRTIINPDNEVIVTNPAWERIKNIIEYIYADEDFKSHFAADALKDSTFVKEVAIFMRNNPRRVYANKDKVVEQIYKYLPASDKFFKNPANIKDLVTNCF